MVAGVGVRVGPRMWLGMPWWLTLLLALALFPFWLIYVAVYATIRLITGSARAEAQRRQIDGELTDAYASIYQPDRPRQLPPAGWYRTDDHRVLRWWDGQQWTESTRPSATAALS